MRFVPLLIFCIAIFIAFSSGTSWGTFAILVPIVVNMFSETDPTMMIVAVSAVLAGAVCGDHISPISDTTIMSSSGAQSNHIHHVQTQMQYAMVVVAGLCARLPDCGLYRKLAHHAGVVACHSDRSPAVSAQAQSGRGRQGIKKKQCFPSGRHCFFVGNKFRIRPAQSLYFSVPSRICW